MDVFTVSSGNNLQATQKNLPAFLRKADNKVGKTSSDGNSEDKVDISEEGKKKAESEKSLELSKQEEELVKELRRVDSEVKAHESAHIAAAGGIAVSGASFEYKKGPDGKMYAVGGEVSIDTSEEDTPQATIDKAQKIRSAALAPSDPSPQDRRVASQASQMEAKARAELATEALEESQQNQGSVEDGLGELDKKGKKQSEGGLEAGSLVDFSA